MLLENYLVMFDLHLNYFLRKDKSLLWLNFYAILLLDVLRSYFVWWLQYLDQFTWQLTSSLKVGLFYTLASSGLRVGQSKCGSILLTANQKSVNFMIDQLEGNRFLFVTPGWFVYNPVMSTFYTWIIVFYLFVSK